MLTVPPSPEHVAAWRAEYEADTRIILKPRPRLKLSEWAERYRQLSGGSAERGPWRNRRVPYLVEIMDAVIDPMVEDLTVMKPARVGFTEAVLINAIGYYMDQDPSPILVALPTIDDAEKFSKTKLVPAIESSPVLRELIPEPRSRDGTNTILHKEYPGGSIQIVGTNSPRMLRMRDARVVMADEVDAMEKPKNREEGKGEGDPLELLQTRNANWPNRKNIRGSSPTWKGASRIEEHYQLSDRRKYWMPCPHCGEYQILLFGGREKPFGLKWISGRPETVVYLCVKGCTIQERSKQAMHAESRWIAEDPGNPRRGYWFNALISMFDGVRWPRIVEQFLRSKDDEEKLQVVVNTVFAETYEVRGEQVQGAGMLARREVYPAPVPMGVGILTAFVDVQKDWGEVLVRGWGAGEESWRIRHESIPGDPEGKEFWDAVDAVLFDTYRHESGAMMTIRCALVDSGDRTAMVYEYVKPRQKRGVFASKGDKQIRTAPIVVRAKKPNDSGIRLLTIGTFTAKRRMFGSLRMLKPGPRCMHFHRLPDDASPARLAAFEAQDAEYFRQFEAERLIVDREGSRFSQVAARNEAIDLEVGCLAALYAQGPTIYEHLEHWASEVAKSVVAPAPSATAVGGRRVISSGVR